MKQWAKIVVTLERAVPQTDAQKYLEEYSIGLGPSDDPRYEQRGVMVIKTKSKTRAKQRKGAVSNWKWVLKTTLGELKKRGMTGEEMRRLMWGRASITSPKKVSKKYAGCNQFQSKPLICISFRKKKEKARRRRRSLWADSCFGSNVFCTRNCNDGIRHNNGNRSYNRASQRV